MVDEGYPAECISFRVLLNPKQPQYGVKGHIEVPTNQKVNDTDKDASGPSEVSLQLKPATKDVIIRQPETPKADDDCNSQACCNGETVSQAPVQASIGANPMIEFAYEPHTAGASTKELDEAIRQAKELQHVPLELEDEAPGRPGSSNAPDTDDEAEEADHSSLVRTNDKTGRVLSKNEKFQCMQKHSADDRQGPNAATIAILQQMADYYDQVGDQWRTRSYRKAMASLRNQSSKVCTKEQAEQLPYVGSRLAAKIEEIVYTNRLRRLDNARAEPMDGTLQLFMGIYGAGFAQASKWISSGFRTIQDLLEKASLSDNQKVGIAHYEDFKSRVPRNEVEQHGEIVRRTLQAIDPAFQVIVGGSYRRGAETSGDIDCIITRADTAKDRMRNAVVDQLVPTLFARSFLKAALAVTSQSDGTKWHGASCLPGSKVWRRIDFLLVPSDEIGAALIYFTGNDIFNRSLRLLASTKGMRLNQRGLYKDVMRGKGREKLTEGTLVEGKDEKRIFEILGVPWRPPEHRIC